MGRVGDVIAVNSTPPKRWRDESNGDRFLVLTRSQITMCLRNASSENLREHTGHGSKCRLGGGISMKISFNC